MTSKPRFLTVGLVLGLFLWANPLSAQEGKDTPSGAQPKEKAAARAEPAGGTEKTPATEQPNTKEDAVAHGTTVRGGTATPDPAKALWPIPVIYEPSQGRPIFITPGETFYSIIRLTPQINGDVNFCLRHAQEPSIRVPLRSASPPSYYGNYCHLLLEIPASVQPGLYDLELTTGKANHESHRCIKVVDSFKTKFRFVHLSSMNVGDLTAPNFDEMLPKEVNLLAPEFIIATGDYTEWARAKDDATSWTKVLKFFEQFDAPVFMLCGLHDHEASFQEIIGKPNYTIDYGAYHGILLLDHPGNPIDQDFSQVEWVEKELKQNRDKRFNFIASNSDELELLDIWRERGDLDKFLKENKLKMFIAGGSTDWDYKEFSEKLAGLNDVHFIRTHEASTSLRDRATGFSHYRAIEVNGDQITYVYPNDTAAERLQYSIPTGRLRTYFDGANDGTVGRVSVTIQNALNQKFDDAHVWLRVAKGKGDAKPVISSGRLVRAIDAGGYWACDVAVDLPDKGAIRVMAANAPAEVPGAVPVTVEVEGPRDWMFSAKSTNFGLNYFTSPATVTLKLTNNSKSPTTCWPVIRVNGAQLQPDRTACPRLPMTIEPGKSVSIPLVLNLPRVSPGPHAVQVYFLEDPLSRLYTFDVRLSNEVKAAGDPDAGQ